MKIAVPIWQDNVSGVLDFANRLLLVEMENGAETGRSEIVLPEQSGPERAANIRQLGVGVVICGAISKSLACALSSSGIKVLPFVTGSTEQILTAYKESELNLPQYAMPVGCWQGTRGGFGRRRGRCGRKQ